MKVVRFGVSVENSVLSILDKYVEENKFANRSQAIRHLIKDIKMEDKLNDDGVVGGSITLSYNHHRRDLLDKIIEIQHDFHHTILCSQHIHLEHDTCIEIIALKGKVSVLKELANRLTAVKGVLHSDLSIIMFN